MLNVLALNLIVIFLLVTIAGCFTREGDRLVSMIWIFLTSIYISGIGWIIYVIMHFLLKYW